MKSQKITLKAPSVDAKKLFEFAKKNSGGKITSLIFPDPKDLEKKKEEQKKEHAFFPFQTFEYLHEHVINVL